ncbi:MAG TPA: type II secretion system protein [bacterium]
MRKCIKKPLGSARGMTLMEIVIAIVITGILLASLTPVFRAILNSYLQTRSLKEAVQMARIGMDRMVSELRLIPDATAVYITYASSSRIRFIIPDPKSWSTFSWIEYSYNSSKYLLSRENGWISGSQRLVEAVKAFTITYYKQDGTSFTPGSVSQIWRMKIELTIGMPDKPTAYKLVREVYPRMFAY